MSSPPTFKEDPTMFIANKANNSQVDTPSPPVTAIAVPIATVAAVFLIGLGIYFSIRKWCRRRFAQMQERRRARAAKGRESKNGVGGVNSQGQDQDQDQGRGREMSKGKESEETETRGSDEGSFGGPITWDFGAGQRNEEKQQDVRPLEGCEKKTGKENVDLEAGTIKAW